MTSDAHSEPNYMAIFWWLLALTIAEVTVTYTPLGKMVMGFLLISMALSKAALVAMFFMHLRFERVTLGMIAVTPLVLCVFLLFMLLPDSNPFLKPPPQAAATSNTAVAE
ncbi:MAG: cytochrome C oxidase subunit IV family protein [Candidatus Binatia bacterium]